jgi:hypothetical protein
MTVLANKTRTKKCPICESSFETRNTTQKYCKFDCAKKARHTQTVAKTNAAAERNKLKFSKKYGDKSGKLTLKCKNCKQPYDIYQSQVKWRGSTYCSQGCKAVGQTKSKSKPQLVKQLDAVYSKYIREKYSVNGYVSCVSCGKSDEIRNMQNGHYVSRSRYSTRWLDKNCHPQCYRCNVAMHGNYAHYTKFMISTYGAEVIDELITLSNTTPKYSKQELQDMIDRYK